MTDPSSKPRGVRSVYRLAVLVPAAVFALGLAPFEFAVALPAASPFLGLCSLVARRSLDPLLVVCLPVLALAFLRGRWFCRHACPVGLLTQWAGRLSPLFVT